LGILVWSIPDWVIWIEGPDLTSVVYLVEPGLDWGLEVVGGRFIDWRLSLVGLGRRKELFWVNS